MRSVAIVSCAGWARIWRRIRPWRHRTRAARSRSDCIVVVSPTSTTRTSIASQPQRHRQQQRQAVQVRARVAKTTTSRRPHRQAAKYRMRLRSTMSPFLRTIPNRCTCVTKAAACRSTISISNANARAAGTARFAIRKVTKTHDRSQAPKLNHRN